MKLENIFAGDKMELTLFERSKKSKSEIKKIKAEQNIPAVIYGPGRENENAYVDGAEFRQLMKSLPQGRLSSSIFTLKKGKETLKALVKGIQYHKTTYQILHIDFQVLEDDKFVNVKIPIEFSGRADCVGIKQGGTLRQVIRKLQVRCLPKDIPAHFILNVQELEMNQSKRLADITMPEGVKAITKNIK